MRSMTIGDVARVAGVRASAVRFYERGGVLPPASRASGRRHDDNRVLKWPSSLWRGSTCPVGGVAAELLLHRDMLHGRGRRGALYDAATQGAPGKSAPTQRILVW
jgi:MerR family redox-sensitive transcriptional activator SoxR